MTHFILVTVLILLCSNLYQIARSFLWIKKLRKNTTPSDKGHLVILIPVLREQKIIRTVHRTLKNKLLKLEDTTVFFITTEKEEKVGSASTTKEILDKLKADNIKSLHYPKKTGVKSHQLNWAIRHLEDINIIKDETVVAVYDVDSDIKINILKHAKGMFTDPNVKLAQQPSVYLKNQKTLSASDKAFGLFQTCYGVYYEVKMWRKQNTFLKPMRYLTGHGLFIRASYIKSLGYFPEPIEDTRLGHIISYLDDDINVIPFFDSCETAPGFFKRVKQGSVWFAGDAQYIQEISVANRIRPLDKLHTSWMVLNKTYRTLVWLLQGFIVAGLVIFGVATGNILVSILAILYIILPSLFCMLQLKSYMNINISLILSCLLTPLALFNKTLSPWYTIYRYVRSKLFHTEFIYPKTER